MRKGQLIRKVLKAYKQHLNYIQENFQDIDDFNEIRPIYNYLGDNNVSCGVCLFISRNVPEKYYYSGYNAKWIQKYTNDCNEWFSYPSQRYKLKDIIEALQVRVDILEKELASGDKLHQRLDSKQYWIDGYYPR